MGFDWEVLSDGSTQSRFWREVRAAARMLASLKACRPSAVICGGYDSVAAWATFAWCKLFGTRFVMWLESNARDSRPSGRLREWLKRQIVRRSDAIAAAGKATTRYARQLGAHDERIFWAPLATDNEYFAREAQKVDRDEQKKARGYPERLVLYPGRLVREKGVFVLLEAFRQLRHVCGDVGLLIVGHGPEEQALRCYCQSARIPDVYFEGPHDYKEMPLYYALADVVVLPTFSDPWGLIVNEAFACGVPAVVSRVAGVCDDLIIEGETGFSVEPGSATDLRDKLLRVIMDEPLRWRMSLKCREIIRNYTPEACAHGLYIAAVGRLP